MTARDLSMLALGSVVTTVLNVTTWLVLTVRTRRCRNDGKVSISYASFGVDDQGEGRR